MCYCPTNTLVIVLIIDVSAIYARRQCRRQWRKNRQRNVVIVHVSASRQAYNKSTYITAHHIHIILAPGWWLRHVNSIPSHRNTSLTRSQKLWAHLVCVYFCWPLYVIILLNISLLIFVGESVPILTAHMSKALWGVRKRMHCKMNEYNIVNTIISNDKF